MARRNKKPGWFRESQRHSLASRGVKTGRKNVRRPRTPRTRTVTDPERNKRMGAKGISIWFNTDIDTARRIYDWIRENRPDKLYSQHVVGGEGAFYVPEPKDVNDACDALRIPRYELRLIAGRGEGQQMNWGVDPKGLPQDLIDRWQKDLEKHIGEEVYLTGGGGMGTETVKLKGVHQEVWNKDTGRMGLRAELERLETIPFRHKKGEIFDPWIDSWQVSVLEQVN